MNWNILKQHSEYEVTQTGPSQKPQISETLAKNRRNNLHSISISNVSQENKDNPPKAFQHSSTVQTL